MRELLRQLVSPQYTCALCGRSWHFTGITVAIAGLMALVPVVFVISRPHDGFASLAVGISEALAASAILYICSLLLFGRLDAVSRRRR